MGVFINLNWAYSNDYRFQEFVLGEKHLNDYKFQEFVLGKGQIRNEVRNTRYARLLTSWLYSLTTKLP